MDNLKRQPVEAAAVPRKNNPLATSVDLPSARIKPSEGSDWPKLRELWEYRELFFSSPSAAARCTTKRM